MEPYQFRDDLPHASVEAANAIDGGDRELPERSDDPLEDRIPIGVNTRWEAVCRLLVSLEDQGIDTLRVLLALAGEARRFGTEDVERAITREAKLMRSNERDNRPGGRPSKVNELARAIGSTCSLAERSGFEGAEDQIKTRDRIIRERLRQADISRRTFYNLRERVREETGVDIGEIVSPPKPA